MNRRSTSLKTLERAVVLTLGTVTLSVALAADPPMHLRGTIVSGAADKLTVMTAAGNTTVTLDAGTRIAGIIPSSLDQIKAGSYVGIANVVGADSSSALEVVVFPEAMKGAGLGDYAWDLAAPAAQSGAMQSSAMTNGTVKASAMAAGGAQTSSMTNGTVKKTSSAQGLVLTIDYGKGEKNIQVPANVPVVTIVPGDPSKLVAGAHVVVTLKPGMPTNAASVAVGLNGTVPPM